MGIANIPNLKDNEYYTPKYVVDYFGNFDYDPATNATKAKEFGIASFDTIDTDGLLADWTNKKRIWINPPFTQKVEFLTKARDTFQASYNDIFILFPIDFLTTKKFHDIGVKGMLYVPKGRIKFESGADKSRISPAFGSVILHIGDENGIKYIDFKEGKS